MAKAEKPELGTDAVLPTESRCVGIAITLAQIIHQRLFESKEAAQFGMNEPGATYMAIEKAINLLNEACIENVGSRGEDFILFCRDPSAFHDEPEILSLLQEQIKNIHGSNLLISGITEPEQVGSAWYLFGYQLKLLAQDENEERRKEWLTNYFGTFYGQMGPEA